MGWVVNATPRSLYPRERPGTHSLGGWLGPRAGLDRCGKSRLHRDSILGLSSPYRVAIPTELSRPNVIIINNNNINNSNVSHFQMSDPPTPSFCFLGAFQPFTVRAAPVIVFCIRLLHSVGSADAAEKLAASVFKMTEVISGDTLVHVI
jgi:hypothetical protein